MAAPDASKASQVVSMRQPSTSAPAAISDKPDKIEAAVLSANTSPVTPKAANAKTYSPMQVSANLVAEAVRLDQQGHLEDAKASLRRALVANPLDIQARQMLVRLKVDTGSVGEAVDLLVEGRRLHPEQPDLTLMLARL